MAGWRSSLDMKIDFNESKKPAVFRIESISTRIRILQKKTWYGFLKKSNPVNNATKNWEITFQSRYISSNSYLQIDSTKWFEKILKLKTILPEYHWTFEISWIRILRIHNRIWIRNTTIMNWVGLFMISYYIENSIYNCTSFADFQ